MRHSNSTGHNSKGYRFSEFCPTLNDKFSILIDYLKMPSSDSNGNEYCKMKTYVCDVRRNPLNPNEKCEIPFFECPLLKVVSGTLCIHQ